MFLMGFVLLNLLHSVLLTMNMVKGIHDHKLLTRLKIPKESINRRRSRTDNTNNDGQMKKDKKTRNGQQNCQ
jgi:hypothetical protein